MDSSGFTTSPFGPFAFTEAGRALFQCMPDIEKLLLTNQQSSIDLKYLRLAHSIIQDVFEEGQNGVLPSLSTPEPELPLYLDAIRKCTTTTQHIHQHSEYGYLWQEEIQKQLIQHLREARICSERLQFRFEEGFAFPHYLDVDWKAFAKWLCHRPLQAKETGRWQSNEREFVSFLKKSGLEKSKSRDIVWFKDEGKLSYELFEEPVLIRPAQDSILTKRNIRERQLVNRPLSIAALLEPSGAVELVDFLCDLLRQVLALHGEHLSIVYKCWYLSSKETRPSLEDVKRLLRQEIWMRHQNVLVLNVDQCYEHIEGLFLSFQEILKTGGRIFLISRFPLPNQLNTAGIVQVTYNSAYGAADFGTSRYLPITGTDTCIGRYRPPRGLKPITVKHPPPTGLDTGTERYPLLEGSDTGIPPHIRSQPCGLSEVIHSTSDGLPTTLDIVPPSLDRLISETGPRAEASLKVLVWVVFAFQFLTTDQIQAAIGNDVGGSLLASETDTDGTVDLDCLRSLSSLGNEIRYNSQEGLFKLKLLDLEGIPEGGPHDLLTERCLSYMSSTCKTGRLPNNTDELNGWLNRFPLLQYAGEYWGEHAKRVESPSSRLLDSITTFLESRHLEELSAMLFRSADNGAESYNGAYKSMTGLHLASAFGLVKVVSQLLNSRKFTPFLRTEGGWTALHWAVLRGEQEVVSLFLSLPDSTSLLSLTTRMERWTALHLAAGEDCLSIVRSLAADTTVINAKDRWGRTALYLACWCGNVAVVEHLLTKGADPNISNLYGTTLHCAVKRREIDIVRALIESTTCPVDFNIRNPLQLTALEEAQARGLDDIALVLLKAAAKYGPSLECTSKKQTLQAFPLDTASTFHWRCYEIDSDRSCQVRHGKQCKGDVLRLIQQKDYQDSDQPEITSGTEESSGESRMPEYAFRKTFDIANDNHGKIQKYLLSEWQILSKLNHPHIAKYLDSDEDPYRGEFLLYTEFCDRGDLALRHGVSLEDLQTGDSKRYGFAHGTTTTGYETARPLTGVEMWAMIWQLASALAYLHYGVTMTQQDGTCKALLEGFWTCILHRDVKPANVVLQSTNDGKNIFKLCDLGIATDAGLGPDQNQTQFGGSFGFQPPEVRQGEHWTTKGDVFSLGETIRLTFKLQDELLDCKAFRDFLDSSREVDCDSRIDSLTTMEVAYANLQLTSPGTSELPRLVIDEMRAAHQLLGCGEGYLFQAFTITAGFLDVTELHSGEPAKVVRKSIISRLWLLLDDGAEGTFSDKNNESTAHLMVLLEGRTRTEKVSRMRQLDNLLKGGGNINYQWPKSGWTALHLAAQGGKHAAVGTLLQHGARLDIRDIHGRTASDYADESGLTEMAAQLAIPTGRAIAETPEEEGRAPAKRRKLI